MWGFPHWPRSYGGPKVHSAVEHTPNTVGLRHRAAAVERKRSLRSTAASSTPLRPLYVGIQLCLEYVPQRSALMGYHTPHHCGRFMSESDCVRSTGMFRSGVRLLTTIQKAHDYHVTEYAKKNLLSSWRWEQWHKQIATVSANLVEICDSLGKLHGSLCFASKENNGNSKDHINGLVRMKFLAFSNDTIRTATLAHGDQWHWQCAVQCSKNNNQQHKLQLVLYGRSQCGNMDFSTKVKPPG